MSDYANTAQRVKGETFAALQRTQEDIIAILGMDELSEEDKVRSYHAHAVCSVLLCR